MVNEIFTPKPEKHEISVTDVVKVLISHDADVNARNDLGYASKARRESCPSKLWQEWRF
jgi:hypothetical protein